MALSSWTRVATLLRVPECNRRQPRPVDGPVGIENLPPETPHDFVINGLPRLHKFVRDVGPPESNARRA